VPTRIATAEDAEPIARLHAESWRTAYRGILSDDFLDNDVVEDRRALWDVRFANPIPQRGVIVIEDEGGIAGFICVEGLEDARWGSLIDNLHVAPDRKHSGIGRTLMREGSSWLTEHYGEAPVYLWVLEANSNARRFYERLGASNAETVLNKTADGVINRSCRYTWPSSTDLLAACLRTEGGEA
jgi:ribosomal protein S18 acetylase RimI-like enzyme